MNSGEWVKKTVREIRKHAERDGCYDCKKILRAMGVDPDEIQRDEQGEH